MNQNTDPRGADYSPKPAAPNLNPTVATANSATPDSKPTDQNSNPNTLPVYSGLDLRIENPRAPLSSWYDAFTDGWLDGSQDVPYDDYKIVKHCGCRISLQNSPFVIRPRNLAVIFYRGGLPVRALLANILSDYDAMMSSALSVAYRGQTLAAHLRNDLACHGRLVFANEPPSADAMSLGHSYEPMVRPFGSSAQLFVALKAKIKQQRPSGGFDDVDAEYIYRDSFRMWVEILTDCEIIRNQYCGALICRTDESIYPLLQD